MMTEESKSGIRIRFVVGMVISLIVMAVLLISIDLEQVAAGLKGINLLVVIPLLALLMAALLSRAYAWRVILKEKISLPQSFLIINAGYLVNTVLPFRIGELARVFLLLPKGIDFWGGLTTIVVERILDISFALGLFFIGLSFALDFTQDLYFLYALVGLLIGGIMVLVLMVRHQKIVIHWLEDLKFPGARFKARLVSFFTSVISSLETFSDPIQFLRALMGMTLSWGLSLVYQYLLLRAFIPDAAFSMAVFAIGAVAIGISIPSSPGNIGLYEASITLALAAFGVDQSIAFGYALTSHVLNLLVTTFFGTFGLVKEGSSLRDIWQFSKQHRKEGDL